MWPLYRYPPIFYMNDVSKSIVGVLSRYNAHAGKVCSDVLRLCGVSACVIDPMVHQVKAAYTFDAGPNCVVYCLKSDVDEILSLVHTYVVILGFVPWIASRIFCAIRVHRYFPPTTEPEDGKGYYRGITSAPPATPLPESIKTAVAVEPQPNSIRSVCPCH